MVSGGMQKCHKVRRLRVRVCNRCEVDRAVKKGTCRCRSHEGVWRE